MTQVKHLVKKKTSEFEAYLHRFNSNPYQKWNFDTSIAYEEGRAISLFDPNINSILASRFSEYRPMFYSFYSNFLNPTEKNLLVTCFEVIDKIIYKKQHIFLVNFLHKPWPLLRNALFAIHRTAFYSPESIHSILLLDLNYLDSPSARQVSKFSIDLKNMLLRHLGRIAVAYFWQRLTQIEFLESFIRDLLPAAMMSQYSEIEDSFGNCLPYLCQARHNGISSRVEYGYLQEKYNKLLVPLEYKFINTSCYYSGEQLILAPVINQLYLQIIQEYFTDAAWPFISEGLLKSIGRHNASLVEEVAQRLRGS
jgi:hypothetical protein